MLSKAANDVPIETTISAHAPIMMQWIASDPNNLPQGRHLLPNTSDFPYRQRLSNMAKNNPNRIVCLYYLGDTLNDEQKKQMSDLESLAPNIRVIDFTQLDWSEYDFEFNTNMLSAKDGEGKVMQMTEHLKLSNTGNCMGFRLDTMRLMMLLKGPKAALEELKKMGEWKEKVDEGAVYCDFDFTSSNGFGELKSKYGLLTKCPQEGDFFNYLIGFMAVATANHPILINAHNKLKGFLGLNESSSYEEFFNDVRQCCPDQKGLFEHTGTRRVDILAIAALIFDDLSEDPCCQQRALRHRMTLTSTVGIALLIFGTLLSQKRVLGVNIITIINAVGTSLLVFDTLSRGPSFEERVLRDGIITETNAVGVALYILSNYEKHSEKIKSYLKKSSSKINIDSNRISELTSDILTNRDCYTYMFIGCSLAEFLLDKAPKEIKKQVGRAVNIEEEYVIMCKLLAAQDNVHCSKFDSDEFYTFPPVKIKGKTCSSWTLNSNDSNIDAATSSPIWQKMYESPEISESPKDGRISAMPKMKIEDVQLCALPPSLDVQI